MKRDSKKVVKLADVNAYVDIGAELYKHSGSDGPDWYMVKVRNQSP